MKFEKTDVWGFEHAIRGARNPMNSWDRMDSGYFVPDAFHSVNEYEIGQNDMKLLQNLIKASIKEGNSHSKFLRQIMVSVDITAPLYWWKEADTYKVGTVANSTSTMHKLAKTPITKECFECYETSLSLTDDGNDHTYKDFKEYTLAILEALRVKYLETNNREYWIELIRMLPNSWLQTRTLTLNYQILRQMYFDRRHHKLTEWSVDFVNWIKTLPYAKELIMYEGK